MSHISRTLKPVLCLTLLSTSVLAAPAIDAPRRPNFVFIYADDWRWDCLGIVQREQGENARFPWLETPRLDRLAAEGVRFNQAFVVDSLCSPGRAAVLTGQYNHVNGIIGNSTPFPREADTFSQRLQTAGYNTGYCGKFHMGQDRERPGYDFVASFLGQGRYFDCPILLSRKGTPARPTAGRTEASVLQQTATEGWIDDVSTDYGIQFIKQQSQDKPFFLFLGFKSVHGPRGGENLPERYRGLYANEEARDTPNVGIESIYNEGREPTPRDRRRDRRNEGFQAYMQHVTAIDNCIGRVLDALEETGQADNTVVIVTSDNGYYLGEHNLGDKRTAYEESIRVPLVIRMPGKEGPRGIANEDMVLNIDHASTILDLAGVEPMPAAQGRSMKPLLSGQSPAKWRDSFFYEYFKEGNFAPPTVLAVRTETHKLITYPGHDEWTEVYDVENDPYELQNLVSDSALREKLQAEFDKQAKAVQFQMPDNVGNPNQRVRRNPQKAATGGRGKRANKGNAQRKAAAESTP